MLHKAWSVLPCAQRRTLYRIRNWAPRPYAMTQIAETSTCEIRDLTCDETQVRQWIVRARSDAGIKTVLAP